MKKRITVDYLVRYGSRLKTETENGAFLLRRVKRFSIKIEDGIVFGYGAVFL